jgi:glycosyltransferase involved in cell wall biosynthesis
MNQKPNKKILLIMQLPPPVHGASVMNQLIKDSKLINETFDCDYIDLATAKDIDDLQKNRLSKYFHTLAIVGKAVTRMLFTRYTYVYITIFPYGLAFIKDSIIVLLARLLGARPLLHLHTYGFKEGSQKSPFWKRYYTYVFKNTEVICLSDRLTEDIEFIYKGKIYILPNGIPQVNFENRYKNENAPVTLLFLSNLIRGKGILVLMDALEILHKKELDFRFRVVGSERDITYNMLEALAKQKGLEEKVHIAGAKYEEEKYDEYKNAGVFILPSNYDTFGLVLLEAMQFGVPCISTNIGGIPDVLGDGRGVIIKAITAEAIAEAVEHLIKNPELRAEMSRKGFDYFGENFTDRIFEKRLINIFTGTPELVNERLALN